jgi:hypothetical protein
MRPLAVTSALAICALTLAAPPGEAEKPAAPLRELPKADAARAKELYAKAVAFGRAGKFVEAQGPVLEMLALYTRVLGEDHFETGNCRREIEVLKKLAALPEASRVEYTRSPLTTTWRSASTNRASTPRPGACTNWP